MSACLLAGATGNGEDPAIVSRLGRQNAQDLAQTLREAAFRSCPGNGNSYVEPRQASGNELNAREQVGAAPATPVPVWQPRTNLLNN
jgi:hypothetical protein